MQNHTVTMDVEANFPQPQTKQDYMDLLDESIRMGKTLNQMWSNAFRLSQDLKCR